MNGGPESAAAMMSRDQYSPIIDPSESGDLFAAVTIVNEHTSITDHFTHVLSWLSSSPGRLDGQMLTRTVGISGCQESASTGRREGCAVVTLLWAIGGGDPAEQPLPAQQAGSRSPPPSLTRNRPRWTHCKLGPALAESRRWVLISKSTRDSATTGLGNGGSQSTTERLEVSTVDRLSWPRS